MQFRKNCTFYDTLSMCQYGQLLAHCFLMPGSFPTHAPATFSTEGGTGSGVRSCFLMNCLPSHAQNIPQPRLPRTQNRCIGKRLPHSKSQFRENPTQIYVLPEHEHPTVSGRGGSMPGQRGQERGRVQGKGLGVVGVGGWWCRCRCAWADDKDFVLATDGEGRRERQTKGQGGEN